MVIIQRSQQSYLANEGSYSPRLWLQQFSKIIQSNFHTSHCHPSPPPNQWPVACVCVRLHWCIDYAVGFSLWLANPIYAVHLAADWQPRPPSAPQRPERWPPPGCHFMPLARIFRRAHHTHTHTHTLALTWPATQTQDGGAPISGWWGNSVIIGRRDGAVRATAATKNDCAKSQSGESQRIQDTLN